MNADEIIFPKDHRILEKALEQHRKNKALATLLVMDHPGVGTQFGEFGQTQKTKFWVLEKRPFPKVKRLGTM